MTTRGVARLRSLLDTLGVRRGELVYLHTSFTRIRHFELSPKEVLGEILQHLGPTGTLVLPCFAWHLDTTQRPWKGYADYYEERPVFDAGNTPANIGVIPELFRTMPGVRRSAHYWWSVAALGPLAGDLIRDQQLVEYPYGPDSAFGRMRRAGTTIVGLGVSLNTTSLAPVVDHELGEAHPQELFSNTPLDGVVIDVDGRSFVTYAYWLLPEVVRLIKPAEVIERTGGLHGRVRRADEGETIHFAYAFGDYFDEAMKLAAPAVAAGTRVPWLEQYPLMKPGVRTP